MVDVSPVLERIDLARERTRSLAVELKSGLPVEVMTRENPDGGGLDVSARLVQPIPTRLRVDIGLVLSELRASLDMLVMRLAAENGAPHARIYFPFGGTHQEFEQNVVRIRALKQEHRDILLAIGSSRERSPFLWALSRAENIRKHQDILAASASLSGASAGSIAYVEGGGSINVGSIIRNGVIEKGFSVGGSVILRSPGDEATLATNLPNGMQFDPRFVVVFAEPEPVAGREVASTLWRWADIVTEVVHRFADHP